MARAKKTGSSTYENLKKNLKGGSGNRSEYWSMKDDGTYIIRLLEHENVVCIPDNKHWNCRTGNKPVRCPDDDSCPICAMEEDLDDKGLWSAYPGGVRARTQLLAHAVVRDGATSKQVIAQLPMAVGNKLAEYIDPESDFFIEDFLDLKKGYDLMVKKVNKPKVSYTVEAARKATPVTVTTELFDLTKLVTPASEEDMAEAVDYLTALLRGGKKGRAKGKG